MNSVILELPMDALASPGISTESLASESDPPTRYW